jgi:hypothetical protein
VGSYLLNYRCCQTSQTRYIAFWLALADPFVRAARKSTNHLHLRASLYSVATVTPICSRNAAQSLRASSRSTLRLSNMLHSVDSFECDRPRAAGLSLAGDLPHHRQRPQVALPQGDCLADAQAALINQPQQSAIARLHVRRQQALYVFWQNPFGPPVISAIGVTIIAVTSVLCPFDTARGRTRTMG